MKNTAEPDKALDPKKLDSVKKVYERISSDEPEPVEPALIAETDPPPLLKEAEEVYEKLEKI